MNKPLEAATLFMINKHSGQKRKDGSEYFWHPIRVATKVEKLGLNYQITALLHDTLEDTDATENEIGQFGENILTAVKLLSRNYAKDETTYIEEILKNPIAKAVKNADRIDNLTDCLNISLESQRKYVNNSELYYRGRFSEELDKAIDKVKENILANEAIYINIEDENLRFAADFTDQVYAISDSAKKAFSFSHSKRKWCQINYWDVAFDAENLTPITKDKALKYFE